MRVSVIVTSFNQREYLIEALESLLGQTVSPYEIIVCDDFSTQDDSRELIRGYASKYPNVIKPVFQDHNVGVAANRNSGFMIATGDFITTLDGDDRYLPRKIEKETKIARRKDARIVYSNVFYIDARGKRLSRRFRPWQQLEGDLFESIATIRQPGPREMLIPRRCFEEIGLMDESLRIYEDWDLAIRLASRFHFAACHSALVEQRRHAGGLHCADASQHLRVMIKVLHKALDLCERSLTLGQSAVERRIEAFLELLRARKALLQGDLEQARTLARRGIRGNAWRSMGYDLSMRSWLPGLFRTPPRLYDSLMIGPLAIPYYALRGILET